MRYRFSFLAVLAIFMTGLAANPASAGAIVVSVTGPTVNSSGLGLAPNQQAGAVEFTTTGLTNATISMNLDGFVSQTVSAWITNQIGPGTTAANVLDSITFTGPLGDAVESPFMGLTLPAGTYYVVLSTIGQPNETGWDYTTTPTVITGPGDTYDGTFLGPDVSELGSFAPSYSFISATTSTPLIDLKFSVTNVSEPATLALLGIAFAGIGWARRRNLH